MVECSPIKKVVIKKAAIDPKAWFMSHSRPHSVSGSDFVLSAGREAIETHGGDVVSAMRTSPDLRAEIVLAYLAGAESICAQSRDAIVSLAGLMEQT